MPWRRPRTSAATSPTSRMHVIGPTHRPSVCAVCERGPMKKLIATATLLLLYGLPLPATAVANSSCGRLSTGDTFNDLNKILDCIEAKATGQPVTATPDETGYVEEQEPNDRIASANPIALGTTVRGKIKKDNEFDIYRFSAPATDGMVRIIIRQTHTRGFCPRIKLYDDLEVQVEEVDGSANKTVSLPLETQANRHYYITITCFLQCNDNMDYELVVTPE